MSENTIQSDEVRSAVRQRYGQIARDFDKTAASCCGLLPLRIFCEIG